MGGTSWGAPTWAAYCALINQARATNTQASLGFLGAKIYPLIGTSSFRDIISGSNGAYSAGKGYDMVTGVGVANVTALVQSLGGGNVTVATAPSITAQPQSVAVTVGQNANFSVTANGTATLTYQWKKNGTAIAGATTAALTIANAQTTNAGNYTVVVSNSVGNVTSATAILTVNLPVIAPTITTQPKSVTVTAGQTATFSVTANGTATLTYQWSKNGTAISGATSASLVIASAQAANAGSYTVTVTNSAGHVTSTAAVLTVNPAPVVVKPAITQQPTSLSVTAGQSATFSVLASGSGPLSYQWKKNGTAISGATSASYTISSTTTASAASYTVTVSNSAGSVTSSAAVLTVNAAATKKIAVALPTNLTTAAITTASATTTTTVAATPPTISTQPQDQTVAIGGSVTLSVSATGTGPLSYQWTKNGAPINGATDATLALSNVQAGDSGYYAVAVYNSVGLVWSDTANLTVDVSLLPPGWVNASSIFFPANGVPAGLTPLQGQDATAAQAWLNQLTLLGSYDVFQTTVLNQLQASVGSKLSGLLTALSLQNQVGDISFDLYEEPWLLEYNSSPKLFFVASNGDIYVQALSVADDGSTAVASTLCLPANN
jgi:hypothetical protein